MEQKYNRTPSMNRHEYGLSRNRSEDEERLTTV